MVAGLVLLVFSLATCAERVRFGAEMIVEKHLELLAGKRVGIICNHTSLLPNGTHLVDTLISLGVKVTALFGPEHGIRGMSAAGVKVERDFDAKTKLPVYSLYGKEKKPTPEMLQNVDMLLFDIQDVGARFYTYASTMAYAMEAAAENNKSFVVLDRPNPVNGIDIEGPVLDSAFKSFVGLFPIPIRHGLTLGELAKMIVGEKWLGEKSNVDLTVIPMEGWKREMWYNETGLPWIPSSPNMKTLATATVYPGTCLFEGTNVTEGRGTLKPFEYIGAPWIDADTFSVKLHQLNIPGVRFEPIQFIPQADSIAVPNPKYKGVECGGVFVHITNRTTFQPVHAALNMLLTILELYSDKLQFQPSSFDRLAGTSEFRASLLNDNSNALSDKVEQSLIQYREMRERYILYK